MKNNKIDDALEILLKEGLTPEDIQAKLEEKKTSEAKIKSLKNAAVDALYSYFTYINEYSDDEKKELAKAISSALDSTKIKVKVSKNSDWLDDDFWLHIPNLF